MADNLTFLLANKLALTKAESVTLYSTSSLPDIEQFCQKIVSMFRGTHSATNTISFRCEGLFREVQADRKLMQQIVTNLLSNAIKHSPSGGNIALDLTCQENDLVIQVKDQGIGIAEDDITHLFDLFYQSNNAEFTLDLVIVKEAVELQGGTIQVDSKVGSGTTFTVCLPRFPNTKLRK